MKIKSFIFSLLLLLLIVPVSDAQLFWKISGGGLSKPSYMLGTHHLVEKEKIPSLDKITDFIPQTDVVVGETDMSKMLSMQMKVLKSAFMKDTTVRQLLSATDYALVDTAFRELMGKGMDKLGRMKPSMLSTLYVAKLYMKEMNTNKQPEAVDVVVQKLGKKAKKKIVGLETVDQQINMLLNSGTLKRQAEKLVEAVREKDNAMKDIRQLNEAYLAGDLDKMVRLSKEDETMNEEELNILIYSRNKNWMEQLKKLMPEKSCFIAVGCYHLLDDQGLINLMRQAGYTVEPVEL